MIDGSCVPLADAIIFRKNITERSVHLVGNVSLINIRECADCQLDEEDQQEKSDVLQKDNNFQCVREKFLRLKRGFS